LTPITLLVGKETILRDEALRRIQSTLFKDPSSLDLNQHRFDASRDDFSEILTQAQTAPFLAQKRLVIVDQVDALKDKERKALLEQLEHEQSYSVWVLMTDERSAKTSFLKKLAEIAEVIPCEAPYKEGEVKLWIRKQCEAEGRTLEPQALAILFELIGKNMSALKLAIEQLAIYTHGKQVIAAQDVEQLLGESAEQNVFELYDALKAKRLDLAIKILNRLKAQGKRHYEIIGSLVWQFDRVLRIKNLISQGLGVAEVAGELRIHRFFAEQSVRRARSLSESTLRKDLQALLSCDLSIKRGIVREDLAVERCLLSLNEV